MLLHTYRMLQQPVDGFTGTFDHVWSTGHVAIPKLIGEAVRENVREAHFFQCPDYFIF